MNNRGITVTFKAVINGDSNFGIWIHDDLKWFLSYHMNVVKNIRIEEISTSYLKETTCQNWTINWFNVLENIFVSIGQGDVASSIRLNLFLLQSIPSKSICILE